MIISESDNAVLARFDRGERLPEVLVKLASDRGWTSAAIAGIGGVEDVVLAYFDLAQKSYLKFPLDGVLELLTLQGNLSILNDQPLWHLHATVGDREGNVRGGHLVGMTVAITLECWIWPGEAVARRRPDPFTGLNLLSRE